jgi:hypothetical protein
LLQGISFLWFVICDWKPIQYRESFFFCVFWGIGGGYFNVVALKSHLLCFFILTNKTFPKIQCFLCQFEKNKKNENFDLSKNSIINVETTKGIIVY